MSLQEVYEWNRKFASEASTLTNALHSGRGHTSATPDSMSGVERLVQENRCVAIDKVAAELNISHGSEHHIIHDTLQYHKVSARWVPRQLTPELKERLVMSVRGCSDVMEPKEIVFGRVYSPATNAGFTLPSQRPSEQVRSGNIHHHGATEALYNSVGQQADAHGLLGLYKPNTGTLHAQGTHCQQ